MSKIDFRKMYEDVYADWSYSDGFELDPSKTALVLIDLQPHFTGGKVGMSKGFGTLLKPGAMTYFVDRVRNSAIPNTARLLDYFRRENLMVAHVVTWSETEDLSDMTRYYRRAIKKWEAAYGEQVYRKWNEGMWPYDEVAPKNNEQVFAKRSGSAFSSSMLDWCLRNAGIETLVLTGCNTNGCVFESAVVASNIGYELILASDATACFAPELQAQAEEQIGRLWGITRTTDETIQMIEDAKKSNKNERA